MKKDRIQIDGEWYVKESSLPTPKEVINEITDEETTHFQGIVWESDKWCFEATKIFKDPHIELYDGLDIKVTDKRPASRKDWIEHETMDNETWMFDVINGTRESMVEANKIFDQNGINEFRSFLRYLIKEEWLKE